MLELSNDTRCIIHQVLSLTSYIHKLQSLVSWISPEATGWTAPHYDVDKATTINPKHWTCLRQGIREWMIVLHSLTHVSGTERPSGTHPMLERHTRLVQSDPGRGRAGCTWPAQSSADWPGYFEWPHQLTDAQRQSRQQIAWQLQSKSLNSHSSILLIDCLIDWSIGFGRN